MRTRSHRSILIDEELARFVAAYGGEHGFHPTVRTLAAHLGLKPTQTHARYRRYRKERGV